MYQYWGVRVDQQKYPPLGKMVDIGGYSLHMVDQGAGFPTVVIDAGLGGFSLDSQLVQPEIAKFTRVVSYDRAGYGWSEVSPLARTSENIVSELHLLLQKSGVPGPYILVGYSFGGLNVRLFADRYPDEVAGVILVDASHEDTKSTRVDSVSKSVEQFYHRRMAYLRRFFGIDRLVPDSKVNKRIAKYPHDVQQMYLALRLSNNRLRTAYEEENHFDLSCRQLKSSGGFLGQKPLVVITAGKKLADGVGQKQEALVRKDRERAKLQQDLVTKSVNGKQVFAEMAGHNIAYDQPEVVVEIVREMVNELRRSV